MARVNNLTLEGAKITCRNFSGKESRYNKAGDRNFLVLIDPDMVNDLRADGWNVKQFKPNPERDEEPSYYIQVKVSYKFGAPNIFLLTRNKKIRVTEETVNQLDWTEIASCAMTLSPSYWEMNGRSGVAAYLKSLYVEVIEDELAAKYANYAADESDPFVEEDM